MAPPGKHSATLPDENVNILDYVGTVSWLAKFLHCRKIYSHRLGDTQCNFEGTSLRQLGTFLLVRPSRKDGRKRKPMYRTVRQCEAYRIAPLLTPCILPIPVKFPDSCSTALIWKHASKRCCSNAEVKPCPSVPFCHPKVHLKCTRVSKYC